MLIIAYKILEAIRFYNLTVVLLYGTIIHNESKVLEDIFATAVKSGIAWKDIEGLLLSLEAEISEGSGSRVRIFLNGIRAVFHRPHPKKETDKGAVISMRRFLKEAKVTI